MDLGAETSAQVFISYSRKDSAAAERLRLSLITQGFEAYLDKHDIAAGEEWRGRLGGLIETADTMVFLVSPDSIASPICDWEVDHAEQLGKRIIPVVCRSPEGAEVPDRLRRLNYVFMRDETEEATQLPRLSEAIKVDIAWVRTHTRYGELAVEWDRAKRPSRLLLRGASIREAEHWRDTRPAAAPALTEVQSAYIAASRRGAGNRQRGWVAGAFAVAVLALGLSAYAFLQQQSAEASRRETGNVLATSDYRQGSELTDDAITAPDGIAFLSRAARGGDSRAQMRLWTLWQQRSFWLPLPDEPSPASAAAEPAVPADIAQRFAAVDFNGTQVATHNLALSADNGVVFVAIGGVTDPDVQDVNVRVFRADGTAVTDWFVPPYAGEMYLSDARGVLSAQGRYLALEIRGWREAAYVIVYDLNATPLAPFADKISATGSRPGIQDASFSVLRFQPKAGTSDADEAPLLLAGSSRGDAGVYSANDFGYFATASASHRAAVTMMNVDDDAAWMISASSDRFVAVTDLSSGAPIGSPMRAGEAVTGISRTSVNEISIDQEGGIRTRFDFQPPIGRPYSGHLSKASGLGATQEACYRSNGLNASEGPVAHPSGLTLSIERGRNALVTRADGSTSTSQRFLAAITTVCASDDGRFVTITTDDFHTEVWTADFSRRLGPAMDESQYLGTRWPTPEGTDWVQLSPDGAIALVRSSFWDPPNLEYFWLMAWDTATGLPLSEHQAFEDDGSGGISSGLYDPAVGEIAYLVDGQPMGRALKLDPPDVVRGGLADYMEGVVGQSVDATGLSQSVPVANRIRRLIAGNDLIGASFDASP